MPPKWVHDRLEQGKVLMLIDGLDEISNILRDQVYEWLKDLIEDYPRCHFLLTSRSHVKESRWRELGFWQIALCFAR